MLSGLWGLGAQEGEEDQQQVRTEQGTTEGQGNSAQEQSEEASTSTGTSGLSFWSIANVLSTTVKARADELVKSVAQTDWKSELMAFSKEAAEEGKQISHRAVEVVEHLPDVVEHLHIPEKAEKVAAQLTHSHPEVSTTINHVGASIKTFGTTLFSGTKELIEQVRDAVEAEIAVAAKETRQKGRASSRSAANSVASKLPAVAKYNRFEAEVAAMQRDSSTYCDEPAEVDEYTAWRAAFSLQEAKPRIDALLAENSFMAELQSRIVPVIVEHDDFWHRYFFRLHKLQAKAEMQQKITQLATKAHQEEEELGWDDLDTPTSTAAEAAAAAASTSLDSKPDTTPPPPAAAETATAAADAGVASDSAVEASAEAAAEVKEEGDVVGVSKVVPGDSIDPGTQVMALDIRRSALSVATSSKAPSEAHETGSDASRGDWCVLGSRGSGSAITGRTSDPQDAGSVATDAAGQLEGQASHGGDVTAPSGDVSKVSSPSKAQADALQEAAQQTLAPDAQQLTKVDIAGSPGGQQPQVSKGDEGESDVDVDGFLDELDLEPEPAAAGPEGGKASEAGKKKAGEEEEDEAWGDWD